MQYVITLASGLVFGIGLTISGMVNPEKVLAFLDPVGGWDLVIGAFAWQAAIETTGKIPSAAGIWL